MGLFVCLGNFIVTVTPQVSHPLSVSINIITPCHVHDLISILFPEFVLKAILEFSVSVFDSICEVLQLIFWTECLGWWILERLVRSKVRCVFIVSQIHVEVDLISVQSQILNHVTIIRCVSNEIQVTVGRSIHRLTTLPASNHSLEFRSGGS